MAQIPNTAVDPSWLEVIADPVRLHILHSLLELVEASANELAVRVSVSDPALRRHLDAMVALGLVHEHPGVNDGLTPGRPATRFSLDPETRQSARALFEVLARPLRGAPRRTP